MKIDFLISSLGRISIESLEKVFSSSKKISFFCNFILQNLQTEKEHIDQYFEDLEKQLKQRRLELHKELGDVVSKQSMTYY